MHPPDPGQVTRSQPLVLVFGVMVALTLWITTRGWHAPILDRHEFRQLQTALSTYWIKEAGYRLDYETPLFGPPWSLPFEFPVYQWCVATTSRLLGTGLEATARGVSLSFFLATLPAIYALAGLLGLAPSRRLLVLSTVLASPTYLFYARSFMIETTALCLATWYLYAAARAVRDRSGWFALAATALGCLAGLAKVTTFIVFLPPAVVLAWLQWRVRGPGDARLPLAFWRAGRLAAVPVLVSAIVSWWWLQHGDELKRANAFASHLASGDMRQWVWGTWPQRLSGGFWSQNWQNISGLVLGPVPMAVLVLGAALVEPAYRRVAAGGAAFFLGALMLFANLYYTHDYYYCASAMFLLAGAGFVLVGIWDSPRLPAAAKWLAIGLVLGGQLAAYHAGYGPYQRRELPRPPALAEVVRTVVPPDQLVVIYGWDWNALLPYYAERRTVMVPRGREAETAVLDAILRPLPAGKIAALIIHADDALPVTPGFVRERLNRFNLAPAPFATSADGDLYLPEEQTAAAAARLTGRTFPGVTLYNQAAVDPYGDKLRDNDLAGLDLPMAAPRPVRARSMLGVGLGSEGGHTVILAHPVSELYFVPPAGASRIEAEVGIASGAFAPDNPSPTDGVTVEIFEVRPTGLHRTLYRRDLDPVHVPADRGPQAIALDGGPFTGTLIFRITPGPKGSFNSDWAYWARIKIH